MSIENYEFAAKFFSKALRKNQNNVSLMSKRVTCYEHLGYYRKAIKDL
jgi:hypothetical protein